MGEAANLHLNRRRPLLTILQASTFGIDSDLVRISVGLEDVSDLCSRIQRALDAVASVTKA